MLDARGTFLSPWWLLLARPQPGCGFSKFHFVTAKPTRLFFSLFLFPSPFLLLLSSIPAFLCHFCYCCCSPWRQLELAVPQKILLCLDFAFSNLMPTFWKYLKPRNKNWFWWYALESRFVACSNVHWRHTGYPRIKTNSFSRIRVSSYWLE